MLTMKDFPTCSWDATEVYYILLFIRQWHSLSVMVSVMVFDLPFFMVATATPLGPSSALLPKLDLVFLKKWKTRLSVICWII